MNERRFTPFLGVALYVWLLTAAAVDGSAHRAIRQSGFLDGVGVAVAVWAALDWWWNNRSSGLPRPSHALGWTLLALCGWVLACAAAAAGRGDFTPETAYRSRQFVIAVVMFFSTTTGFVHSWHLPLLALPLAGIVAADAVSEFDSIALDQNIAAAAVLTVPALAGAAQSTPKALSLISIVSAFVLSGIAAATRNRGAGLALAALVPVLAWQSARRRVLLPLATALLVAAMALLSATSYFSRYRDIWTGGPAYDTVQERLDLWADAWRLAAAHPILGVGPGNYGAALGGGRDPHNHVMAMLSETGFPGGLLYAVFFAGAFLTAATRVRHRTARLAASTSAAGIAVFLIVGFFLGLQTHAMAFVYAGLAQVAAWHSTRADT